MEFTKVKSSNVEAVAFDEEKKELHVRFLNGGHYAYLKVPKRKFKALLKAESIGKFLNSSVKGKHEFRKAG